MFQKFMHSVVIRESGPLSPLGQGFVAFIQPVFPVIGTDGTGFLRRHTGVVNYVSEDSKSRRTSKLHDLFKSYNDFNNVFHR